MELDDFDAFFAARRRALLDKISLVMGKRMDDVEPAGGDDLDTLDPEDDADDLRAADTR